MTNSTVRYLLMLFCLGALVTGTAFGQHSDLTLTQEERDSILADYDNLFPLWGRQAIEKGFDVPYPLGINISAVYMDQNILISDLGLSTGDNPTVPTGFIKLDDSRSKITTANLRVDLWVLPFLNVYGFGGEGFTETQVKITEPISFESGIEQEGAYYGFGFTGAAGIKRNWLSVDMNFSWTDLEKLDRPVRARLFGIRYGRTFKLDRRKRLAVWVGTMHQKFESETEGSVLLSEVIPPELGGRLEDYQDSEWYKDLNLAQKKLVDQLVQAIGDLNLADAKVNYYLDKRPKAPWNLLVGANFELNKRWMIRAEAGFIGRKSFLLNLNYRIPI